MIEPAAAVAAGLPAGLAAGAVAVDGACWAQALRLMAPSSAATRIRDMEWAVLGG